MNINTILLYSILLYSKDELSSLETMRDVFDYCKKNNLLSVAQGMIEVPPPLILRQLVAESILDQNSQHFHQ